MIENSSPPIPNQGKRNRETMTFDEMAREFAEVFDELDTDQINEMLALNVPFGHAAILCRVRI